jgi:flagellar protein FlaG
MNLQIDALSPATAGSPAATAHTAAVPSPVVSATAPAEPRPDTAALKNAARQINDFLKSSSTSLEFSVDDSAHRVVVRIVDAQTDQVIRQIPSEEVLAIARSLDRMNGLLLRQTA